MYPEKSMYRTTRIVWYIAGAIEVLLAFRFALKLFAANQGAGFTDFIYSVSSVFVAPFQFVFGIPAAGGSALELSTLLAMAVYWLIAWGLVKLIAMQRPVSRSEAHESLSEEDNA